MRYSGPETNTGPYLVYEKFELGIFHCPCSLLGVSDGRVISNEYRTQTVRFCSYQPHVLLTLLNWSTTMRPFSPHTLNYLWFGCIIEQGDTLWNAECYWVENKTEAPIAPANGRVS